MTLIDDPHTVRIYEPYTSAIDMAYTRIYSLHASYKGILHILPWTKLADDGGGSMACFFMACSSKIIARETVKKKRGVGGGATSRVDGERPRVWVGSDLAWGVGGWGNCNILQLGRFFFHRLTGDYLRATGLEKTCSKSTSVIMKPSPLNKVRKTHVD